MTNYTCNLSNYMFGQFCGAQNFLKKHGNFSRFSIFLMVSDQSPLPQASRFACHQPQPLAHPYPVEHPMWTNDVSSSHFLGGVEPISTVTKQSGSLRQTHTHTLLHILTLSIRGLKTTKTTRAKDVDQICTHASFFCSDIRVRSSSMCVSLC